MDPAIYAARLLRHGFRPVGGPAPSLGGGSVGIFGAITSEKEVIDRVKSYVIDHSSAHDLSHSSWREVWIQRFGSAEPDILINAGGIASFLDAADACASLAGGCDGTALKFLDSFNVALGKSAENGWVSFPELMTFLNVKEKTEAPIEVPPETRPPEEAPPETPPPTGSRPEVARPPAAPGPLRPIGGGTFVRPGGSFGGRFPPGVESPRAPQAPITTGPPIAPQAPPTVPVPNPNAPTPPSPPSASNTPTLLALGVGIGLAIALLGRR